MAVIQRCGATRGPVINWHGPSQLAAIYVDREVGLALGTLAHFGYDDDPSLEELLHVAAEFLLIDARLARHRAFQRKELLLQDPFDGRSGRAQRELAAVEYHGEAAITADELRPARDGIP